MALGRLAAELIDALKANSWDEIVILEKIITDNAEMRIKLFTTLLLIDLTVIKKKAKVRTEAAMNSAKDGIWNEKVLRAPSRVIGKAHM
jgi:hypothetical protein